MRTRREGSVEEIGFRIGNVNICVRFNRRHSKRSNRSRGSWVRVRGEERHKVRSSPVGYVRTRREERGALKRLDLGIGKVNMCRKEKEVEIR